MERLKKENTDLVLMLQAYVPNYHGLPAWCKIKEEPEELEEPEEPAEPAEPSSEG